MIGKIQVSPSNGRGDDSEDTLLTFDPKKYHPKIDYMFCEEKVGMTITNMEKEHDFAGIYCFNTGDEEIKIATPSEKITEKIESAIELINEVIDVYDDEIERFNTFSIFEKSIKDLWDLKSKANNNFSEILVLLEVSIKNSRYQNYSIEQFEAIKKVLNIAKPINISSQIIRECRKILKDSNIDLQSPIRVRKNYIIEIKKIEDK